MRPYCTVAAALAWFFLALQFFVGPSWQSLGAAWNFFSYFTILSNILSAATLTAVALGGSTAWPARPKVATAVALYMTVTGLVYTFILAKLWNPQGWLFVADAGLHYVMPVVYDLFWLAFVAKGALTLGRVPAWLIFPLLYGIYSLVRGPFVAWYPYPFIDVSQLGYGRVAANMAILLIAFLVLGAVFVALDRALGLVPTLRRQRAS
ncbi:MAG TPA: Pr6Pr family membrane protein [Hyphomicrobiales bacterium]|nr:Pr6Pr family membrane protein [Hyphomicrobiales bacterium]